MSRRVRWLLALSALLAVGVLLPHADGQRGIGWPSAVSRMGQPLVARSVASPERWWARWGTAQGASALPGEHTRLRSAVRHSAGGPLLGSAAWSAFRPGGGHTYGGGSSSPSSGGSSGGSGSDGTADLIIALIYLCIEVPEIGIPLLVIVLIVVIVGKVREQRRRRSSYVVGAPTTRIEPPRGGGRVGAVPRAAESAPATGPAAVRSLLDGLRRYDPDFSIVLFEDFLYALYAAAHESRGGDRLFELSAYLDGPARATLAQRACPGVEGVVIGAMTYDKARLRTEAGRHFVDVKVRFESNYTETDAGGRKQTFYAVEHWVLVRARDAKTKRPDLVRTLGCPNCGGPQQRVAGNRCEYCGQTIVAGEFDWAVTRIDVERIEARPPQLTGDAPEAGTSDPTVVVPGSEQRYRELAGRDPSLSWAGFAARVGLMFAELQKAWSEQSWMVARPYVSDQLFQMQLYWIETYQRARLRNITENARIVSLAVSDVRSDAHYDAIVLRVFATGLDYTVDERGKVVSGSKRRERQYSEYWTLIRGRGASGGGTERVCPACGGPLDVNMAGQCTHCQVKLTTGKFDWVLSRIEQDESYRG